VTVSSNRHGNRYYENLTETLWRHRWVDFASVSSPTTTPRLAAQPLNWAPTQLRCHLRVTFG